MKNTNLVLIPVLALAMAACSAKITGDDAPPFGADTRDLRVSQEPLSGTVDGKAFKAGKAVATRSSSGEYELVLVGEGVEINCNLTFPLAPHITFVVPGAGSFPYDGSGGGRIVNFIFPYTTANGGGSDNLLASKSLIQIDKLGNGTVEGSVAALSSADKTHSYDISGKFKAILHVDVDFHAAPEPTAGPMAIKRNGAAAFAIAYTEAVNHGATYEVRLMDREPKTKCNSFSAWQMVEAPIKYVTVEIPKQTGAFTIAERGMEYGDEGASTGWSTKAFNGKGMIQAITNSQLSFSLDAKDFGGQGIAVSGSATAKICQ